MNRIMLYALAVSAAAVAAPMDRFGQYWIGHQAPEEYRRQDPARPCATTAEWIGWRSVYVHDEKNETNVMWRAEFDVVHTNSAAAAQAVVEELRAGLEAEAGVRFSHGSPDGDRDVLYTWTSGTYRCQLIVFDGKVRPGFWTVRFDARDPALRTVNR